MSYAAGSQLVKFIPDTGGNMPELSISAPSSDVISATTIPIVDYTWYEPGRHL